MRSSGLAELDAVLAVARHRGFRVAATELGMSRSALSHAIAALEAKLGVRLFHRTTRSVSLTEAGEQFVSGIAPALGQIREAMDRAGSHRETPAGTLRINASAGAAQQMEPIVLGYLHRYPDMTVDIVTEGRLVDIVLDGFDAGVRLAELVPQDMISVPMGPDHRFAVVGSPAYFEQHPKPRTPADISRHRCIRRRLPSGGIYRWEFERRGEALTIDGEGQLILDEPSLMLAAARAGFGLAYLSEWNVAADLAAGSLVRVLDEWTPPFHGLALYYPGHRHVPAGLRAMIDLIREKAVNRSLNRKK
jgi:DNA-binding transcriptional LysR family regulator